MPLLRLLTRSTTGKQRIILHQRNTHTATGPNITRQLIADPIFRFIYSHTQGREEREERSQMLQRWQSEIPLKFSLDGDGRPRDLHELGRVRPYEELRKGKKEEKQLPEGSQPHNSYLYYLYKRCKTEILEHIDRIEQVLGYNFEHYEDVFVVFPRFPVGLRLEKVRATDKTIALAALGKSALCLAMRDENKWHYRILEEKFLKKHANAMSLNSFIIDRRTLAPIRPSRLEMVQFEKSRGWSGDRLSLVLFAILGAVFRDGGIDALKRVLKHNKFSDAIRDSPSKLHDIGLHACQVLLLNSLYNKVPIQHIKEHLINIRCNEPWHATIYEKVRDVSQFIDTYISKRLEEEEGSVGSGITGGQDEWVDKKGKQLSPGLRYQTFLGITYRDGGLALVRDMLNSHDPGYSCRRYPAKYKKTMAALDLGLHKHPFWQTPAY